jgi:hypothetical protein
MGNRVLVLVLCAASLAAAACGNDEAFPTDGAPRADAPEGGFDANDTDGFPIPTCTSPADTADITTMGGGPDESYDRLYAGGVFNTGPLAPAGPGPEPTFGLKLTFSNDSPIDAGNECLPDTDCAIVSLVGNLTEVITPEDAVGDHPIELYKTDDVSFTVNGTVTIDTYESPFGDGVGSLSGSVTGTTGGRSVTGTFDNDFCAAMIGYTI